MGSIADKLKYLLGTKEAIKEAIRRKGISVTEDDTFRSYADKIAQIEGSTIVNTASQPDVIFYNIDGSVYFSYTAEEFLALEDLPAVPQHDYLVSQGWNRSISEMKEYVVRDGFCTAEPLYTTTSGHTMMVVEIPKGRIKYPVYINTTVAGSVSIDWGDGSDVETFPELTTINTYHQFPKPGNYTIIIKSSLGEITFGNGTTTLPEYFNNAYRNMLKKVYLGSNVNSIADYSFYYHTGLEIVTFNDKINYIGKYAFANCINLKIAAISDAIASLGSTCFGGCWNLVSLKIPKIHSITSSSFCKCFALKQINLPNTVTEIQSYAFIACTNLKRVGWSTNLSLIQTCAFAHTNLEEFIAPLALIEIQTGAFEYSNLKYVYISERNSIKFGNSAFYRCSDLTTYVNKAATTTGTSIMYQCLALKSTTGKIGGSGYYYYISGSVSRDFNLSFSTNSSSGAGAVRASSNLQIANDVDTFSANFYGCSSLVGISVHPTVTSISLDSSGFTSCSSLKYIDLRQVKQLVTLNTNTPFSALPNDYVVVVPRELVDTYKSATNWSRIADHIVGDVVPDVCTALEITASDVSANKTTTNISYRAIVNGYDPITGIYMENVDILGTDVSEEFPANTSVDGPIVVEISYTYMGVTAVTNILQAAAGVTSYTVNLNSQWRLSETVPNPDSALYEGVYESNSNYKVSNGIAKMYIDIEGYTSFKFYIRSNAESSYDFVRVGTLDKDPSSSVYVSTSGKQNAGTAIGNYTEVVFNNLDGGSHRITIDYKKDGSIDSGTDRGYVLIPTNQQ